jgi:succinate dehydrogenase / fumarate reductase cytochrome b subunit
MAGSTRNDTRPLSPHVQVWRWHLTMAASIAHRVTGVGLAFGTLLIAAWLVALASGPDLYGQVQAIVQSWPGRVILFLWTMAVLYHLLNGIRHLLWDGPRIGFNPKTASAVSAFNFAFAAAGAVSIWFFALMQSGLLTEWFNV